MSSASFLAIKSLNCKSEIEELEKNKNKAKKPTNDSSLQISNSVYACPYAKCFLYKAGLISYKVRQGFSV